MSLTGSIVALATPFCGVGAANVDRDGMIKLVNLHRNAGTSAVVCCGTTGEASTLTPQEYVDVIKDTVVAAAGSGMQVIAGTGTNDTRKSYELTSIAAAAGVDACLVVAPYYNKPTQQGIRAHFRRLDQVGIPLVVYNIPGRTGVNIEPETLAGICEECSNVVGIKASNGNLDEITETIHRLRSVPRAISVLSGDDSLTLPIMAVGGVGVISVAANIMPRIMAEFVDRCGSLQRAGSLASARSLAQTMNLFCRWLLMGGGSPAQTKAVMEYVGLPGGDVRLPLVRICDSTRTMLFQELRVVVQEFAKLGVTVDSHLSFLL